MNCHLPHHLRAVLTSRGSCIVLEAFCSSSAGADAASMERQCRISSDTADTIPSSTKAAGRNVRFPIPRRSFDVAFGRF